MNGRRWALVAAAEDLETAAWAKAIAAVGGQEPRRVPWSAVLDGSAAFKAGELVHALRLIPTTPARYGGSRERYEGLAAALDRLQTLVTEAGATVTVEPGDALLALDRLRCSQHLATAGITIPLPGRRVLRQRYAEPGDAVTEVRGGGIFTTLTPARTRDGYELRNSRRQREYRDYGFRAIADTAVVRDLLEQHEEVVGVENLSYIYVDGDLYRFRLAVVDGEVTHAAGRFGEFRLAREYYGGRRREVEAFQATRGETWAELVALAERAATAFPGLRSVGVDVTAGPRGDDLAVYDIDPFGARLPGALGLINGGGEGLDVASTTVRAWL